MFGQLVSVDPATYSETDGYTLKNRWLISRNLLMVSNPDALAESFLGKDNYARTATIYGDEVLVSKSVSDVDDSGVGSHILRFDLATGESKGVVNLTLDGQPYHGLLSANTIGVDDYNHLWICGYVGNLNESTMKIYLVDIETGVLTPLPVIDPAEAGEQATTGNARFDFIDVIGDLTGEECSATVMSPMNGDNLSVLRAIREQGSDEFVGGFDGFFFWDTNMITETCPMVKDEDAGTSSPQANWGTGPIAKMINDEEHMGITFYIDGNTTCPAIYNTQGAMTDSFNSCISLAPQTGTNGVAEFTLGSNNFIIWSVQQYDKSPGCIASIGTFGDGFDFKDLNVLFTFPKEGLGEFSDVGTRIHCLMAKKYVDSNDKEGVYILDYKCQNGLGVYVFAEKDFIDPNGDNAVEGIEDDFSNAPAVYFNLQGQKIENPAAGLYIVKRGNKVVKEMVK